jgi:hypothetical protein
MSSPLRSVDLRPALVVTIDTEEEGLWCEELRPVGNSCRNVLRLPRLHALFARLGVRPTYLVDHPVATDADARSVLRELAAGGASEIGAHLHPWCSPPFLPGGARLHNSYPHRLPRELQQRKLMRLHRVLCEAFGAQPLSYRAGRWGFGASTVPVLQSLGFTVDTSVKPLWWDPARGGPSFQRAPCAPYRLAFDDACRPGGSAVLEVPTGAAVLGRHGPAWERWLSRLPSLPGLRRWLRRLGLRTLEPEDEAAADLCRVVDELVRRGAPVLNVAFHSSTLLPGATPFARSEREVTAFLARLQAVLEHALGAYGALPLRLRDVPLHLGGAHLAAGG